MSGRSAASASARSARGEWLRGFVHGLQRRAESLRQRLVRAAGTARSRGASAPAAPGGTSPIAAIMSGGKPMAASCCPSARQQDRRRPEGPESLA